MFAEDYDIARLHISVSKETCWCNIQEKIEKQTAVTDTTWLLLNIKGKIYLFFQTDQWNRQFYNEKGKKIMQR